jgi:hypothetical protein
MRDLFINIGKFLFTIGFIFIFIGILFIILSRFSDFRIPRIPLDIVIENKNFKIYFPLGTSILLSIILTFLLNLLFFLLRK